MARGGPSTIRVRVTRLGRGHIQTGEAGQRHPTFNEDEEFDCPSANLVLFQRRGWIVRLGAASPASGAEGAPPDIHDPEALERLLARATRDEKTGCLLWQGAKQNGGYGQINFRNRIQTVHRLSWIAHHGPVPPELYVCHACDSRTCIAIEHLFLGTAHENYRDMKRKGRARFRSKLTPLDVATIRQRLAAGERPSHVARDYQVNRGQIFAIRNGTAWRDVPANEKPSP